MVVVDALARRPLALVGLGVLLFSMGPVLVAETHTTGAVLSFWRLWMGVLLMGSLAVVQIRRTGRRPDRIGWRWSMWCGLAFGAHQVCFMVAIKRTSVVDVTLMQLIQPIIVGVLAVILFRERPGAAFRAWSLVSIAGAAIVVLAGASGPEGDPLGVALAAANVAFFAVYFTCSKLARDHIDTVPFLFGMLTTAAVGVSIYAVVAGQPIGGVERHDLVIAATLALVPGGLGHFVTTWPLKRVPANVPPLMQVTIPFFAGTLAWMILGQPIKLAHLVGGLVSVVGVVGALLVLGGDRIVLPGPDPVVIGGD